MTYLATQPVPTFALATDEAAAAALGVSVDFYCKHIRPELRVVRRGRKRLVPVAEITRWLSENAARALEGE
jgi:hypothetical protein